MICYFRELKIEKNLEERRELRRNLDNKRRQIMHADNCLCGSF